MRTALGMRHGRWGDELRLVVIDGAGGLEACVTVRSLGIVDAVGYDEASLPRVDDRSKSLGRALQHPITEPIQALYASSRYLLNRLMIARSALQMLH